MARHEKKVRLFIVEGLSDKVSFEGQFVHFFSSDNVRVAVMRCDVTAEAHASEILSCLNDAIEQFCNIEKIRKSDIRGIIHLVDTDGAFVPDSCVRQNLELVTEYTEEEILAKNTEAIVKRNSRKACTLEKLYSTRCLSGIDYKVFFLSRTLEHVLHNKIENLTDNEKTELSLSFDERYAEDLDGFLAFISDPVFAVDGDYRQTWNFISQGTNSLKRYSNLHLLFCQDNGPIE